MEKPKKLCIDCKNVIKVSACRGIFVDYYCKKFKLQPSYYSPITGKVIGLSVQIRDKIHKGLDTYAPCGKVNLDGNCEFFEQAPELTFWEKVKKWFEN